jgi:hypothetical protein
MKFDNRFDIVSGANSSKDGKIIYIDRRIPQFSPKLKDKSGKAANLWKYLGIHEESEAAAMARGMPYLKAHTKIATPLERKAVEADGVSWKAYSEEMDGYLNKIEHEKVKRPPPASLHVNPAKAISHHHSSNN